MRERIQAIIFDCDGVLVDSEALGLEVEYAMLAEVGLTYEMNDYKRRFLGMPYDIFHETVEADVLARTGKSVPPGFRERMVATLSKAIDERLLPIDGAAEFVSGLVLPRAVASSSKLSSLNRKLEITGLHLAFGEHVYSTDQVKRGKPAPDLFLHAAAQIGAAPENTLVIEDSANGIKGAKAAGMIAVGFTAGGHCRPDHGAMLNAAGADLVFDSYRALAAFLSGRG